MASATDSWHLAQNHSNAYWDAVNAAYETDPPTVNTVTLADHLHDWPSTKYDEFYANVVESMKTHMGPTHLILTHMTDLKAKHVQKNAWSQVIIGATSRLTLE